MDFKQKAEEKKMSMSKNIARLAVTAGLTAALSFGGVMAPVTMAFAEGDSGPSYVQTVATSGSVTITEGTYTDTTFKGIQIFRATVTQGKADADSNGLADENGEWEEGGDKTLSDIEWASEAVKNAVTGAFNSDIDGSPDPNAGAQAWAKYINDNKGSNVGKDAKVDAGSTLDKIAKKLEDTKSLTWTNTTNASGVSTFTVTNSESDVKTGYWLFVTASVANTTARNKDTYTSPIFTIVGGSEVKVTPKKDVPNVTKAVKDDKNGQWVTEHGKDVFAAANKAADSAAEQPVDYRLAGTVASNINTYVNYSYTFTDKLPTTMEPVFKNGKPDVEVKIGETVVKPDCYSVTYDPSEGKNTLTVSFGNLKEAKDTHGNLIDIDKNSKVYVNYQAKLVADKITQGILGMAQTNTVMLTYSNNPHDEGATGDTVVHPAYDYTYGIDVTKVGSDKDGDGNLKQLKDVEFTLQEVVGGNPENQFIDAQGVKHNDAKDATLKTTVEGEINVVGLDEGTYILKEVKPAPGYNNSAKNGVTFIIKRDSNSQLYQAGQSVIPSADSAIVATDGVVKDNAATATTGKLSFTIVDQKGSGLPLTGLNGVTFTWIAGGAVLCIGVAHLIRSRKQAEESEQE